MDIVVASGPNDFIGSADTRFLLLWFACQSTCASAFPIHVQHIPALLTGLVQDTIKSEQQPGIETDLDLPIRHIVGWYRLVVVFGQGDRESSG